MARGTIVKRQRKTGPVYMVRVDIGPDPITGKRRQPSETFDRRKDAEKRLAE